MSRALIEKDCEFVLQFPSNELQSAAIKQICKRYMDGPNPNTAATNITNFKTALQNKRHEHPAFLARLGEVATKAQLAALKKYPDARSRIRATKEGKLGTDTAALLGLLDHPWGDAFAFTNEFKSTIRTIRGQRLEEKTSNCMEVTDPDTIQASVVHIIRQTAMAVPKSRDAMEAFTALAIASGRRFTELVLTGTFTPAKASNAGDFAQYVSGGHIVLFGGQLKTKKTTAPPYSIPIMWVDAPTFIRALTNARASLKYVQGDTASTVHSRWVGRANRCIKSARWLNGSVSGRSPTFHTTRSLYVFFVTKEFPVSGLSANMAIKRLLGHATLSESLVYMCVTSQSA